MKLISSCEDEKKITVPTKNELNMLSKDSIGKYEVIINYEMQLQQT